MVQDERCTSLYGVPTMFIAKRPTGFFHRFDLSSLRTGIMAGSPCPVEVMKQCVSAMHMEEVTICYGMTETSRPCRRRRERTTPSTSGSAPWARCTPTSRSRSSTPTRGVVGALCASGELCTRNCTPG